MAAWIFVVTVVALISLLIAVRRRPKPPPRREPPPPPVVEKGLYHGVEIRFQEKACCEWVKKLRGARLLPHQARLFPLPLPECDAARCRCRYVHFDDRRTDDDRRIPFSTLTTAFGRFSTQERRSGDDRREGYVSQEMRLISDADFGLRDEALASTSSRR